MMNETENYFQLMLLRLDGLVFTLGGAGLRGWWCGVDQVCGRTQHECLALTRRVMTTDGREIDRTCSSVSAVWCKAEDTEHFHCSARRQDGTIEIR